jgi:hypothetical protein
MIKTYLKTPLTKVKTYDSCYKVYGIILKSEKESFIKIGATINLKTRIQHFIKLGYNVEIIFVSYFNDIKKQLQVEKIIHRYLSAYKYTPSIPFDGKTECFDLDSLLLIKEII